jgi:hypothetical protein
LKYKITLIIQAQVIFNLAVGRGLGGMFRSPPYQPTRLIGGARVGRYVRVSGVPGNTPHTPYLWEIIQTILNASTTNNNTLFLTFLRKLNLIYRRLGITLSYLIFNAFL